MSVLAKTGCLFIDIDNLREVSEIENFDFEITKVFYSRKKIENLQRKKFEEFGISVLSINDVDDETLNRNVKGKKSMAFELITTKDLLKLY